jgi:hypothetical protein
MVSAAITTASSGQIPFPPAVGQRVPAVTLRAARRGGGPIASEEHVARTVSESQLQSVLSGVPGPPRVVVSGNFATPWPALAKGPLPPDVVLIQTTRPSAGTVSLGLEANILPAAIEAARARGGLVVAQLNPQMPDTSGDGPGPG